MKRGRTDQVSVIWTEPMLARALELRHQRLPCAQIDRRLGLRIGATWVKLQTYQRVVEFEAWRARRLPPEMRKGPPPPSRAVTDGDRRHEPIPAAVLVEREALAFYVEQDLTARLMGDPPPWRSALGQRR